MGMDSAYVSCMALRSLDYPDVDLATYRLEVPRRIKPSSDIRPVRPITRDCDDRNDLHDKKDILIGWHVPSGTTGLS